MTDDQDKEIAKLQKKVRKLEAALKIVTAYSEKTEMRMRKAFEVVSETIPVPMIISNENGEIFFANLNAQNIFGYSFEEFTKIDSFSLYDHPEDRQLYEETLLAKGEVNGFRTELIKSEGSLFPAVMFSHRINIDGQNCILTIVHDLSEVMALERQLRQTQKMEAIGTLASGIAHDFNNILAAIFGYTELAVSLLDRDSKQKDYLDKVQKAANRGKSMVMQMMAFCRQPEKEKRPFDITSVVAEAVKMMSDLTPSDIVIISEIRNQNMIITGDSTQIHQVLINLITNSVQALSGRGGHIQVVLEKIKIMGEQRGEIIIPKPEPGIYAEITVKDDGPGIGKEIIHNIFDPFFTTKPVGQGSGMGLAVVHGIIRGHSGFLSVDSEPGKGAAFHCCFPVTGDDVEHVKTGIKSTRVGKGDERILLVDDDPMILDVCAETLIRMGYMVTSCDGSRKALKIFKTQPENFDLVITDNTMPEMSGPELSKEILKISSDIPIVLITGDLLIKESDMARAGIQAFIQKPFDGKKMQSVIREVLDGSSYGNNIPPAKLTQK